MLDACNHLSHQIEIIEEYVKSLRVAAHMLEGKFEPSSIALGGAGDVLNACHEVIQTKYCKYGSSLSKLLSLRFLIYGAPSLGELGEALNGSKVVAFMACGVLGMALSLKSKFKLAPVQEAGCSTMLLELEETMVGRWWKN